MAEATPGQTGAPHRHCLAGIRPRHRGMQQYGAPPMARGHPRCDRGTATPTVPPVATQPKPHGSHRGPDPALQEVHAHAPHRNLRPQTSMTMMAMMMVLMMLSLYMALARMRMVLMNG